MKDKSIIKDIIFYLFVFAVVGFLVIWTQPKNADEKKIVGVVIKGAVNAPGYYELEYESRVKDVLRLAGGETEEADLSNVNLAFVLIDGEEIVIPEKADGAPINSNLININTADIYNLCKLEGIGEALATEIVNYRAEYGLFNTIEDIKKVKGIGSGKFNKIKTEITVN